MDEIRVKAGLSIEDVVTGMRLQGHHSFSRTHFNQYRNNEHEPGFSTAYSLSKILKCRLEDFVSD